MKKKPVDASELKKPQIAARILRQLRKNARATLRELTVLEAAEGLDLLPREFSLSIYRRQLTHLLYATPPVGRPKKPQNSLTAIGKKLARDAKTFSPEKMKSIRANKIEAENWELTLSGKKLTDKSFAETHLRWTWGLEHGRPPTLREMAARDYKSRLKTLLTRLSEVSEKSQKKN